MQEVSSPVKSMESIPGQHLKCSQGNIARLLCCSPNCEKSALVCRKKQCECLENEHGKCDFIYTQGIIEDIQAKKIEIPEDVVKAIDKVDKIYDQAIDKLSMDREAMQKWKENYGLSIEEIEFLEMVDNNEPGSITGQLVSGVKDAYLVEYQKPRELSEGWAEKFWERSQKNFDKIFHELNRFTKAKEKRKAEAGKIYYELDFSRAG